MMIAERSFESALIIIDYKNGKSKQKSKKDQMPIPEPDKMTFEFLIEWKNVTKNLLSRDNIPLTEITRNAHYGQL